jgi:predicted nuclease of predicted toxin-antitoxin system
LRFLIDAQLPPRLARMLRRAGHDAEHVFDLGLLEKPDVQIWSHAARTGAIILTKDSDFAAMRLRSETGPAVVWLRLGNLTNAKLEATLKSALAEIVAAIEAGERLIEVV